MSFRLKNCMFGVLKMPKFCSLLLWRCVKVSYMMPPASANLWSRESVLLWEG
jgi:hypothetical protein